MSSEFNHERHHFESLQAASFTFETLIDEKTSIYSSVQLGETSLTSPVSFPERPHYVMK